jgi:hypothetical protein
MAEKYSQDELDEARFMQLIFTFQAAAMQQMGKLMNPLTGKVERDMEQAKNSIDMVAMLEEKTRGNLNERERKLLEGTLFELRMNYLDELKLTEEQEEKESEEVAQGKQGKKTEQKTESRAKAMEKKVQQPAGKKKAKARKKKTDRS